MTATEVESIAVVGISCRLPGAPGPSALWRLLADGEDAIVEMPSERHEMAGLAPDAAADQPPGSRLGGFLEDVDRFDAAFFGIGPREAAAMDPRQRLVLELGWEALEDAGVRPSDVGGAPVGVFLGAIADDYSQIADRWGAEAVDRHTLTGLHRSLIANRLSYALGFTGPSLTVDTAQASSLVAVHLACESLLRGDSALAMAGGIHLNLDPRKAVEAERFGGLSPDGRCHTFDARANGYVRGEGAGVVLLKPLTAARADGDNVYCVIRGSAMNHDGASPGLTVPAVKAQEAVLREAMGRAGVHGSDLQYVELHGSGTPVGDPIEAEALGAVLGGGRSDRDRLRVGSVKTNVGHLEGAGGIAGLIKVALAIRQQQLPPSLNFESENPQIPLAQLRLRVQQSLEDWPRDDHPLVAGVSSFGVGGTNCHVVLAEDRREDDGANGSDLPPAQPPAPPLLVPLSAKTPDALREAAGRLAAQIEQNPDLGLTDIAYSLAVTRDSFAERAVATGGDRKELSAALSSLAAGGQSPSVATGTARSDRDPVFLFPGQGSQWRGMALELADRAPAFERSLLACEEALAPHVDFSLRDVLAGADGAPSLERIEVVQPALFAVTVSLARLWLASGVRPAAVAGHSQGEVAAAHIAGGLSLEDATRLAAVRGQIISSLAGKGGMVSLALPPEALAAYLEPYGDRIEVAAQNGPRAAVVSGDREALDDLLARCATEDVRAREVPAAIPSHSAYVEGLRQQVLDAFADLSPRTAEVPFHSTVTGEVLDTAELGAEYWYRNLRETVRFETVTRNLLAEGHRVLVEISPHPVLPFAVGETIDDALPEPDEAVLLPTLRREEGGPERFALSLAAASAAGAKLDWEALFEGTGARRAPLPTYPFQRKRFWLDRSAGGAARSAPRPAEAGGDADPRPDESHPDVGGEAHPPTCSAGASRLSWI